MLFKLNTEKDPEIKDQTVDELIVIINSLQPTEELTIYLKGPGGQVDSANAIIDIINEASKYNNIYLIGYGSIDSSHLAIMFKTCCQGKRLLYGTSGMLHKAYYSSIHISEGGNIKNDSYNKFLHSESMGPGEMTLLSKDMKLTKEERKAFNDNSDVWFGYERLSELLEANKKKTIQKVIKYEI